MKNYLAVLFAFCLSTAALFAQNLALNPDFELRDADFCGIAGPSDLENSLVDWYSATSGTPDVYFTDIAPSCWNYQPTSTYPGPIGIKGIQLPRSGSAMAGMGLFTISGLNQREYIQVQLTSPMVPSGNYLVEYYVSLADYTEFASNNMGFHLSTNAVTSGGNGVLAVSPQYASSNVVGDIQGWVRIADTITASDAFEFLTIGNFSDDASTTLEVNPSASFEPGMYGAYYFVDDVKVERVIIDSTANTTQLERNDAFSIFPNPTDDEVWVELQNGGGQIQIDLFDVNGQLVLSIKNAEKRQRIDLRKLDGGVYFVQVKNGSKSYSEKIVKH
ncbi:MAG: T9SS type A sorting domain-containing protein [Crocinitomicaceae bacterium]|nr:T9SS type A sorting domain-containing protein [Crocinitomicaceae bacterium]